MDRIKQFEKEKEERIKKNGEDRKLKSLADQWLNESMMKQYVYNFSSQNTGEGKWVLIK